MILSELRAQGWKYGCLTALVLALGGWAAAGVQSYRLQVSKGAVALLARDAALAGMLAAEEATKASEAARSEEQALARSVNLVASAYERGRADEKAVADRTTAGLLAGNQRLRAEIRALAARGVSGDPGATGEPSDAAERGAGLIGTAVGVGKACDLRIDALIDAYDAAQGSAKP